METLEIQPAPSNLKMEKFSNSPMRWKEVKDLWTRANSNSATIHIKRHTPTLRIDDRVTQCDSDCKRNESTKPKFHPQRFINRSKARIEKTRSEKTKHFTKTRHPQAREREKSHTSPGCRLQCVARTKHYCKHNTTIAIYAKTNYELLLINKTRVPKRLS